MLNGQLMMALRFYARSHVKAQLREQIGIRARYVEPREITIAAEQWLTVHWREILPEAQAPKKKRCNHSQIPVQNSRSKVEADQC
jgi:hypothetical protein